MKSSGLFIFLLLVSSILNAQNYTIDKQQALKVIQFSDSVGADKVQMFYKDKPIKKWDAADCDSVYMNTASMAKSWTGLAVGKLIDEGFIESEEEPICKYLPGWESGCENDVKIKHLLTMSSGLLRIRPASESILAQDDQNAFAMKQEVSEEPGTTFSYSNESVQLLGILIQRASGMSAGDFFKEHLYSPLNMDSTSLYKDSAGNDIVYGGAETTIQDASKIGLLVLNNGAYNGRQVISEEWIEKSVSSSEAAGHYGYLWWLSSNPKTYAAMGDLGQMTILFPEKDFMFLRQQSCDNIDPEVENLSWMGMPFLKMLDSIVTKTK